MTTAAPDISKPQTTPPADSRQPPFGVNEMRLSGREWLAAFAIVLACVIAAPRLWKRFEPLRAGPDYRIPYALSKDYWLYQRRLEQVAAPERIPVLGDSVVWGEYVLPDGTLSHFLNREAGRSDRFVNGGVNGLFPLAMEGLVEDYGKALRNRKLIVQCNLLWLTSAKADLSSDKPENFNHSRLVPQFTVRVPAYKADANERLSALLERHIDYFAWTAHLQNAYYDQRSLAEWTLEEDGNEPPNYPNAWRNPLDPLKQGIPAEPKIDPQRGPNSPRHRRWNANGSEASHFEWVSAERSLQLQGFGRLITLLGQRGDDVLVLLGPLNEHMIAAEQLPQYTSLRDRIAASLRGQGIQVIVPAVLPSDLYADASHPLTQGYALLAQHLWADPQFQKWLHSREGNRNNDIRPGPTDAGGTGGRGSCRAGPSRVGFGSAGASASPNTGAGDCPATGRPTSLEARQVLPAPRRTAPAAFGGTGRAARGASGSPCPADRPG